MVFFQGWFATERLPEFCLFRNDLISYSLLRRGFLYLEFLVDSLPLSTLNRSSRGLLTFVVSGEKFTVNLIENHCTWWVTSLLLLLRHFLTLMFDNRIIMCLGVDIIDFILNGQVEWVALSNLDCISLMCGLLYLFSSHWTCSASGKINTRLQGGVSMKLLNGSDNGISLHEAFESFTPRTATSNDV